MTWFDYRAQRAARMRREGWSWKRLAAHFEVPEMVIRNWIPEYQTRALRKEHKRRHHCSYRETGSRDTSDHDRRMAAHQTRIRKEMTSGQA